MASALNTFLAWVDASPLRRFGPPLRQHKSLVESILAQATQKEVKGRKRRRSQAHREDPTFWSPEDRAETNFEALRILQHHRGEQAPKLTAAEALVLSNYSGWGGIDPRHLHVAGDTDLPPEIVAGVTEWQAAARENRIPNTPIFRGILDQFFTPLSVCRAMWELAVRAARIPITTVLEPSAGIGRFIQAAPDEYTWTVVERDPILAQLDRLLYANTGEVREELFESLVAEALNTTPPRQFSTVMMNPPYGQWGARGRALDPGMVQYAADTQSYFLRRGLDLTAPGGVLVALVPAGTLTGISEENVAFRRMMLREAHLSGAAAVGVDLFKRLGAAPAAGLVIQCWIKLPPGGRKALGYSTQDQAILAGRYFTDTEAGQGSVIGAWGKGRFGDPVVVGEFDETKTGGIPLALNFPTHFWDAAQAQAAASQPRPQAGTDSAAAAPQGPAPGRRSKKAGAKTVLLRDPLEEAASLNARLHRYYALASGDQGGRVTAESGRSELVADLTDFLATFGNPHSIQGVDPTSWLGRVVDTSGRLHPSLTAHSPTEHIRGGVRPRDPFKTPEDAVRWYSSVNGFCSSVDLLREFPDADFTAVALGSEDLAIEPSGDDWVIMARREYLSGQLYPRLDNLDRILNGEAGEGLDPEIKERLVAQKAWLNEAISPRTIVDIDVRPTSGFLPEGCLSDFVNESLIPASPLLKVQITKDGGRFKIETNGALDFTPGGSREAVRARRDRMESRRKELVFFMGYLNRELQVADPAGVDPGLTNRYSSSDPESRKAEDQSLEEQFRLWVARSDKWRPAIEEAYNRSFRSDHVREYSGEPLPLLRLGTQRKPHWHQWAAARRGEDRGAYLLNWAVGAGKTAGALVTLAWLRQARKVRRALIVVPNPVLAVWIVEAARFLPDYRVGTIGLTYHPDTNTYEPDSGKTEERLEKWRRFAAGGYDVMICVKSAFTRDVFVPDEDMFTVLSRVEWLLQDLGKDAEAREVTTRRIAAEERSIRQKEAEVEADTRVVARYRAMGESPGKIAEVTQRIGKRTAQIANARANIERWSAGLTEPSKTALAKLQDSINARIESGVFRIGGEKGIISWTDLGVDAVFIDEAHHFKNLYYPGGRYGTEKIDLMGSKRWSADWSSFTVTSWDMYVKLATMRARSPQAGTFLLTATPVKNGPLEIYNAFCYLNPDIWTSRRVMNPEEWIDRYVEIGPSESASMDGVVQEDVASVLGFNDAVQEVYAVFNLWMDRITTEDLINRGLIPRETMPEGKEVPADVQMDAVQNRLYEAVKSLYRIEDDLAEIAKMRIAGAAVLTRNDMVEKVALDPRLLIVAMHDTARALVENAWIEEGGKTPPDVTVEYPMPESEEMEASTVRKMVDYLASKGVLTQATIPADEVMPKGAKIPKKRSMADTVRRNLERKYLWLLAMKLDQVHYDEQKGATPPKYAALAKTIREKGSGCGHLVFCDSRIVQTWIRDALVSQAGVDPSRIALLNGDVPSGSEDADTVDPKTREGIALGFNGIPADTIHPITGAVLQRKKDPIFDVLIGTDVMAEGLNLQTRTCAIYHLDLPWEPATLQQRNGRGVRQGNTLGEVEVRYIVCRKSADLARKVKIVGKATWQEQLLSGATAGSIEIKADFMDEIYADFLGSPEEAAVKMEAARIRRAERLRERLIREVTKGFLGVNAAYVAARLSLAHQGDTPDVQMQLGLADRQAEKLKQAFDRLGLPREPLSVVRRASVYLNPNTGFWLTQGERVRIRSSSPEDGVYYKTPIRLEVSAVHTYGTYLWVRPLDKPFRYFISLAGTSAATPALLLDPTGNKSIHLNGIIQREQAVEQTPEQEWETVEAYMVDFGLGSLAATAVESKTARPGEVDPAFHTPERSLAVWLSSFDKIIEGKKRWMDVVSVQRPARFAAEYDVDPGIPFVSMNHRAGDPVLVLLPSSVDASLAHMSRVVTPLATSLMNNYRPLSSQDRGDLNLWLTAAESGRIFRVARIREDAAAPGGVVSRDTTGNKFGGVSFLIPGTNPTRAYKWLKMITTTWFNAFLPDHRIQLA